MLLKLFIERFVICMRNFILEHIDQNFVHSYAAFMLCSLELIEKFCVYVLNRMRIKKLTRIFFC